ncbi:hypothetical protein [Natroniella sulfidigena]|nr:hypothetical protein [Natroniella sulfidigena]
MNEEVAILDADVIIKTCGESTNLMIMELEIVLSEAMEKQLEES